MRKLAHLKIKDAIEFLKLNKCSVRKRIVIWLVSCGIILLFIVLLAVSFFKCSA